MGLRVPQGAKDTNSILGGVDFLEEHEGPPAHPEPRWQFSK
jgi:hypothetical protein